MSAVDINFYVEKINGGFSERFEVLRNFLGDNNKKFNLTAITDKNEVYIKHFLDSVAGEKFIPLNSSVAEIGSGGGFPSLPLKIIREDLSFLLIESTGKKCTYLKEAVDKLSLDCVKVLNARAEDAAREVINREKFDVSVARAVARLNTVCRSSKSAEGLSPIRATATTRLKKLKKHLKFWAERLKKPKDTISPTAIRELWS